MQILEYDQVEPKQVLALNLVSLGYALDAARVAVMREREARLAPFVALYAVHHGKVLGQVGVMETTVETASGPERFGALWAVATHPDVARQGVVEALVEEAHRRMRRQGLRWSFLTTSRYLVAHGLYLKSGYVDGVDLGQAVAGDAANEELSTDRGAEYALVSGEGAQESLIYSLYQRSVSGRLGFIHRSPGFVQAAVAAGDLNWEELFLVHRGSEPVGYAVVGKLRGHTRIRELRVLPGIELVDVLMAVRRSFQAPILYQNACTQDELDGLRRAGFGQVAAGWGTLMVKNLGDSTDRQEVKALLGISSGLFTFGGLDAT